jgi:hypothetical protein
MFWIERRRADISTESTPMLGRTGNAAIIANPIPFADHALKPDANDGGCSFVLPKYCQQKQKIFGSGKLIP